jgi:hypothetical protein
MGFCCKKRQVALCGCLTQVLTEEVLEEMNLKLAVDRTYMCYSGWTNGRVNMYTISKRTEKFVFFGTQKRKIRIYNGEEYCKMGTYANADKVQASVYVGSGTHAAKEFEGIELLNRNTDRLKDY